MKIEQAASDVSLDQLLRAFTAAGGRISVRQQAGKARKTSRNGKIVAVNSLRP